MRRGCTVKTDLKRLLQPIQPQPHFPEIEQAKALVVPSHPPLIVRSSEQAIHRSWERKGLFKRKSLGLRKKGVILFMLHTIWLITQPSI